MFSVAELVDRYFAVWNETDGERRRALIAQTWTEDSSYTDPIAQAVGRDGIDALTQAVQAQFPSFRFRRVSDIDTHHDRVRFGWELATAEGPAVAGGIDFGVVVGDRLQAITGFLDFAPAAAGE